MNGKERISNILKRKPVDRIGLCETFWDDTLKKWSAEGHIKKGENMADHFGHDIESCWMFDFTADLDFVPQVIEETEETILKRDGNGALLRTHKLHDTTPEHVDFLVKEREQWEKHLKPLIKADPRRIDFEGYRYAKKHAAENDKFFVVSVMQIFEIMHRVSGHENLLIGMALDPEWVMDMSDTYTNLMIELLEKLFEKEGVPDGVWFYEDMGFKHKPFFSTTMYNEILQPFHKKSFGYVKSKGLPIIVHSCGFVEPLIPGLLEVGMDCLQAMEVKAGMDLDRIFKQYGDVLSLMGGIDVRVLYYNDFSVIDAELESKIPVVKQNHGYILHTDHSIPNSVEYDTYRHFISKGLELGKY